MNPSTQTIISQPLKPPVEPPVEVTKALLIDNPLKAAKAAKAAKVAKVAKVAICICTCQRLQGLRSLLAGLDRLEFHQIPTPEILLIVVDNEAEGEAFRLCQTLETRWPLRCAIEPRRGISHARNTSIALAPETMDFLALIDDDEVPTPGWLEQLLLAQAATNADLVQGPVLPRFQSDCNGWIRQGRFFEPQRRPTGTSMEYAYAGNLLVRADLLEAMAQPFDERFSLTGGEDSYLFRTLYHRGHRIIWADEAVVYESVPDSRLSANWLMQRGYRSCLTYSSWQQEQFPGRKTQLKILLKGLACMALGAGELLLKGFLGTAQQVHAKVKIARGAGCLSSLMGVTYREYDVIHSV